MDDKTMNSKIISVPPEQSKFKMIFLSMILSIHQLTYSFFNVLNWIDDPLKLIQWIRWRLE